MKFSIKDFFRKCDHIRRKLGIWSHLLKKSLMVNSIFFAVSVRTFFFARSHAVTITNFSGKRKFPRIARN